MEFAFNPRIVLLILFIVALILIIVVLTLLISPAKIRSASEGNSKRCKSFESPETRKAREALEAERDLDFLAWHVSDAPGHFDRAYVRDGNPKWNTVGCNKPHFSREEIYSRREAMMNGIARKR